MVNEIELTREQRLACILKRLQAVISSTDKVSLYLENRDAQILWAYINEIQDLIGY